MYATWSASIAAGHGRLARSRQPFAASRSAPISPREPSAPARPTSEPKKKSVSHAPLARAHLGARRTKGSEEGAGDFSQLSRAKTARTDGAPSALGPSRHAEQDLRAEAEHRRGDGRDADRVAADPPEILRGGRGGLSFVVLPETASRARRATHSTTVASIVTTTSRSARESGPSALSRARASPFAAGVAVTVGGWR